MLNDTTLGVVEGALTVDSATDRGPRTLRIRIIELGWTMPSLASVRPESQRIELLLRRDGYDETQQWVQRTAGMYRHALMQRSHYAADPAYRPLFEKAVREFEEWLAHALDPSPARSPIAKATAPRQAAS